MTPRADIDYSFEAEQAVIGSMIISPDAVPLALSQLDESDFHAPEHAITFGTIKNLFGNRREVDPIIVAEYIQCNGEMWEDQYQAKKFLLDLAYATPTAANVEEYIRIIKEKSTMRNAHAAAERMLLARSPEDVQKAMDALSTALTDKKPKDIMSLQSAVGDVMNWLQSEEDDDIFLTGIDKLDSSVCYRRQRMNILAGFPSDGKTLLALQIAYNMSKSHKVGYFYFEGSKFDTAKRMTAFLTGIDYGRIEKKQVRRDEFGDLAVQHTAAGYCQMDLIDAVGYTTSKIRAITAARGYDVVFIDYVQIIGRDDWRMDETRATIKTSRDITEMAAQLNCCVIALSQFHRLGNGVRRAPTLYDLKQSSQLEQDCATAILISEAGVEKWEDADGYSENLIPAGAQARLIQIAKNRHGERDRWMHMLMWGAQQRFEYWNPRMSRKKQKPQYEQQRLEELPDTVPYPFD